MQDVVAGKPFKESCINISFKSHIDTRERERIFIKFLFMDTLRVICDSIFIIVITTIFIQFPKADSFKLGSPQLIIYLSFSSESSLNYYPLENLTHTCARSRVVQVSLVTQH